MADATTTNKGMVLPTAGGDTNTWGDLLNENFTLVDALLGSTTSLVVSGGTLTLTTGVAQAMRIMVSGTLLAACTIVLPSKAGTFLFHDFTDRGSSVYPITVQTGAAAGRSQNLPSRMCRVFTDGTDCYLEGEPEIGSTTEFAAATPPPLWGMCDGSEVSRTTYADLFAAIGTTWGTGDGSTTFNLPDFRGRVAFGADAMGGAAASRLTTASIGAATLGASGGNELVYSHTHSTNDTGHTHTQSAHTHVLGDAGHTHTQSSHTHTDGGHTHTDSGHQHLEIVGARNTFGSAAFTDHTTYASAATIYLSPTTATQSSIDTSYAAPESTTAANQTATTGVTQSAATATNQTATTGLTMAAYGGGAGGNIPPVGVVNKIIYMGQ